ncbi:LOW QUALITY PROTEIN: amino acid transporter antl1-like isoform x1 [Plakobranchus ocellatus]|uniref:Amino acid transporter antl1-like isoform x1 n=1 Tax=Plakobranchus ocellatus TaxID=259542 RepID=A0AAV3XZC3_9GAST|nr:LOW QUALITY PROTEIN: amino acid transporter antl1-like isoform x1 [Plakobranchus ocellatus]
MLQRSDQPTDIQPDVEEATDQHIKGLTTLTFDIFFLLQAVLKMELTNTSKVYTDHHIKVSTILTTDIFILLQTGNEEPTDQNIRGLTIFTATVFVVGETVGSGVLAFPHALSDTGWIGIAIITCVACASGYTAVLLSRCWILVRDRYVEYRDHPRYPYPSIGQVAFGNTCRVLISISVDMSAFGMCVVFLLMASQNISELLASVGVNLSYCCWLTVVAAVLAPVCWLGTPKDFWSIAMVAVFSVALAWVLTLAQILLVNAQLIYLLYICGPIAMIIVFSIALAWVLTLAQILLVNVQLIYFLYICGPIAMVAVFSVALAWILALTQILFVNVQLIYFLYICGPIAMVAVFSVALAWILALTQILFVNVQLIYLLYICSPIAMVAVFSIALAWVLTFAQILLVNVQLIYLLYICGPIAMVVVLSIALAWVLTLAQAHCYGSSIFYSPCLGPDDRSDGHRLSKDSASFPRSPSIGWVSDGIWDDVHWFRRACVFVLYVTSAIGGFLVYGSNVNANVLLTILPGPLLSTAQVLVTFHLITAFILVLNASLQEGEDILRIPHEFCLRRVLFRTIVVGLILFTSLTVPQFGAILSLIGGSTFTALVFVLPPVLYLRLCSMKGPWDTVEIPLHIKVACVEIIVVGTLAGVASTLTALKAITYSEFSKPCYLN